ncbi:hypothetical protein J4Q44_G00041560, partial [Coregonus suidteri]
VYVTQCLDAIFYAVILNTEICSSHYSKCICGSFLLITFIFVFNAGFDVKVRSYQVEWLLSMF